MALRQFVAYLLYDRTGDHSLLLLGGRLTQQYCVDQRSNAEQERLRYIENNQLEFRFEAIQGLTDAYRHEGTEAHRVDVMYYLVWNSLRKTLSLSGTVNKTHLTGQSNRTLTICTNGFMDTMAIVSELGAFKLSSGIRVIPRGWISKKTCVQVKQRPIVQISWRGFSYKSCKH
ncbi:Helitron helicase [Phytophthora megakarya]|uniref:Helitron helicase n=1 Tax=Phytophthora megakarya TaxID=4795 RepID=A0A225X2M7_9STRA|nr:Helitron helicase [Phytophthora megakarya]